MKSYEGRRVLQTTSRKPLADRDSNRLSVEKLLVTSFIVVPNDQVYGNSETQTERREKPVS
jgi:hypothetical protein